MNPRIQELLGQAKFVAEETTNKKISKNAELDAFAEKFAELIVQDCVSKLAWAPQSSGPEGLGDYNQGWVNGRALAVEHIKEHFGI